MPIALGLQRARVLLLKLLDRRMQFFALLIAFRTLFFGGLLVLLESDGTESTCFQKRKVILIFCEEMVRLRI